MRKEDRITDLLVFIARLLKINADQNSQIELYNSWYGRDFDEDFSRLTRKEKGRE